LFCFGFQDAKEHVLGMICTENQRKFRFFLSRKTAKHLQIIKASSS